MRGVQIIDLACGGLGGFGMGLSSLGANVKLACDIDQNARSIYQQNVGPMQMHDDICTLDGKGLECDILTMGLMCQAFSKAGNGLGMQDPKLAKAYEHSMRLLAEIDAKVIIIECVRQLLTAHGGRDAQVVRNTLLMAGYRVQHRTMNAKGFGLPQSRERVFLVATRIGVPTDGLMGYMFPREQAPSAVVNDIMDHHINADVEAARIHVRKMEPTGKQDCLVEVGRIDGRNSQGYRVYSAKGLGATLTAMSGGRGQTSVYAVNGKARALTPREAGRMQGLPEWAVHHTVKTQACKHAGNAVAIPLVRELVRPLATVLGTFRVSAGTAQMERGAA
jgi:DNA (cytosine-5)-methyltransferase 1